MRRSPAPAPATPPSDKTQSTGSCAPARGRGPAPAQDRCAAPHGRLRAAPGPRPRPPRRRSPTRHVPRQPQQAGGKEDILSSATGPSTARCSKNVTTHQHRPGARPGAYYWGFHIDQISSPGNSQWFTEKMLPGLNCGRQHLQCLLLRS